MRLRLRCLAPCLAALSCALVAGAEEEVEVRAIEAAPGVYMLVGKGGNIGVSSGPDGLLLVDDQFAPLHGKISAALARISDAPVRFLLNTHWHGDHTGGNERFAAGGALILAHHAVRARLSVDQSVAGLGRSVQPAAPEAALPVVTFAADLTLHWNGDEIHALHVAHAHTDGDAIVHFRRANAIHTGDVYFAGAYPFIDLSSGGSIDGLIAAVERVLALANDETAILPGHGPLSNRAELVAYHRMLVAARERVQRGLGEGKDAEALVAAGLLADFDADFGGGFVASADFVRTLHASLAAD